MNRTHNLWGKFAKSAFLIVALPLALAGDVQLNRSNPAAGKKPVTVTVVAGADSRAITTDALTVGEALRDGGIVLKAGYATEPLPGEAVKGGMVIHIFPPKPVLIEDSGTVRTTSGHEDSRKALKSLNVDLLPQDIVTADLIQEDFLAAKSVGRRIVVRRAPRVIIAVDQQTLETASWAKTVGDVLKSRGITLLGLDYTNPSLTTPVTDGMSIRVFRVREFDETKREVTKHQTITSYETKTGTASSCQTRVVQAGQDGVKDIRYAVRTEDGTEVWRRAIEVNVIQPLKNFLVTKERIISPSAEVGGANYGFYSGYSTAYKGPRGTKLLVTNLNNGREVIVTVVDYGPVNDLLDLSVPAFQALGGSLFQGKLNNVKVQRVLCEA